MNRWFNRDYQRWMVLADTHREDGGDSVNEDGVSFAVAPVILVVSLSVLRLSARR